MRLLGDIVEPVDRAAGLRRVGIARRCEHYAERGATVPFRFDAIERAVDAVLEQLDEIRAQTHQDRLRFGIAEPAVELEHARRTVRIEHDACVEKPAVRHAVVRHAVHGRRDDLAHDARVHARRDHGRGRVRAHAARVRALVTIAQPLVILARRERQHVHAVDHDDEARFLAARKSSTTTRAPAAPMALATSMRSIAGVRLVGGRRTTTPLPAASPSAFTTIGAPRGA
jgi:hypothetical protein